MKMTQILMTKTLITLFFYDQSMIITNNNIVIIIFFTFRTYRFFVQLIWRPCGKALQSIQTIVRRGLLSWMPPQIKQKMTGQIWCVALISSYFIQCIVLQVATNNDNLIYSLKLVRVDQASPYKLSIIDKYPKPNRIIHYKSN